MVDWLILEPFWLFSPWIGSSVCGKYYFLIKINYEMERNRLNKSFPYFIKINLSEESMISRGLGYLTSPLVIIYWRESLG